VTAVPVPPGGGRSLHSQNGQPVTLAGLSPNAVRRLRARRDETQAKDLELLAAYHSAIVAALIDVENALSAIHHLDTAREYQTESLTQSEQAFEGAKLRYQAGSGDFLTLLDAQRTLYTARDQSIQYKLARLRALVALCKALGGGWTPPVGNPGSAVSEPRAGL